MDASLFGSDLWKPALDRYAEATGLTVELFGLDGQVVLRSAHATPLVALFRKYGFEPGLFADCARRCLKQTLARPAVFVEEQHGLTVVGTSLVLEGAVVGAAVAGYALSRFSQVPSVQRWARSAGVPFHQFWDIARQQPPVPERRLLLHGELLQILGDALLRENYRTRQLEEIAAQLRAASAAKDEFLAVLSHELRTPLAPIAGWASLLKKGNGSEEVRRAAEAIERNVLLQSRMVEDLLDMNVTARGAMKLDLEILELSACVGAALETVAHEIEKKQIRLERAVPGEPLIVEGDAGRVQQVFRNIFSNAVKFTPAGGRISVMIRREGGEALVGVSDTGVGIKPEFLPHVFEIFRQQESGTRREHPGLGIGLALVKKLTELHRGTVSVASAGAGRGTVVTVQLPLAAEQPDLDDETPAEADSATPALAGLSILVVDDVEDARETLLIMLQHLGAVASAACDGREALDMMQDANPNLVLCDLRMPRMDGFEFMRELRNGESRAQPPVVAVSALASAADRRRALEAGFAGHLAKPYDVAAVVAAVGAALRD